MNSDGYYQTPSARPGKATRFGSFAIAGIWQAFGIEGYRNTASPNPATAISPMEKKVEMVAGALMQNYSIHPWMVLAPALAFAGGILAFVLSGVNRVGLAFVCSGSALAGVILTTGLAMFPFVFPSSTNPDGSLTAYDATSSQLTLKWMETEETLGSDKDS